MIRKYVTGSEIYVRKVEWGPQVGLGCRHLVINLRVLEELVL